MSDILSTSNHWLLCGCTSWCTADFRSVLFLWCRTQRSSCFYSGTFSEDRGCVEGLGVLCPPLWGADCLGSKRAAFSVVSCQAVQGCWGCGDMEEGRRRTKDVSFSAFVCFFSCVVLQILMPYLFRLVTANVCPLDFSDKSTDLFSSNVFTFH